MTKPIDQKRIRDLVRLFGGVRRLYERLGTLVQTKIDAMRRADIVAIRELGEQELVIAQRLQEHEGLRRQLMNNVARQAGMSPRGAEAITVSQLAKGLDEPQRTTLLEAGKKLREVMAQVAQTNRVAGAISREILNHMKWVFASVRPAEGPPVGYSGDGALVSPTETRIFDMVG